jgi:alpha-beta hydrolase superfamily lysophospholipase
MISSQSITARALDGLQLAGTLVSPSSPAEHAVVLVHGGGVTRDEGGFFTRLADGLAEAGIGSVRFDLRGHGESEGLGEERTLTEHLNDIRVSLEEASERTGATKVNLLGASFGGGLCAYYAAKRPGAITSLVLLNPQLRYKERYIDQKPHWHDDRLDDEAAKQLAETGYLQHSPTVRQGRAFLNEVFWINPFRVLSEITAPTLIVHGTKDTFVPIESSRTAVTHLSVKHELVEIKGAQHGFAVHDDPQYAEPQTQEWQAFVIRTVVAWIRDAASGSTND